MKTETTIQNQPLPARPPNLFQHILSPKALIAGAVLATVWIYLGFQTVRLVEAMQR
jgi:hypothetical protein